MRWTVVLVAETEAGQRIEEPVLSLVRDPRVVLEQLGLTLAEGKQLLQAVQERMVVAQVKRHGAVYRRCGSCQQKLSTKDYQRQWFRSAFGKVPIRVRRLTSCRCQGQPRRTFSSLPLTDEHGLIAPEWLYLQAKLASLLPFARVAALLGDVLPANEGLNAETVRTRGKVAWDIASRMRKCASGSSSHAIRRPRPAINSRMRAGVTWIPPSVSIVATCGIGIPVRSSISKSSPVGHGRRAARPGASRSCGIGPFSACTTYRRLLSSDAVVWLQEARV
jgi:hypothetical protein